MDNSVHIEILKDNIWNRIGVFGIHPSWIIVSMEDYGELIKEKAGIAHESRYSVALFGYKVMGSPSLKPGEFELV